jgi:hypothetical protein
MNYQNPNGFGGPPQGGYGPPQGGYGAPPHAQANPYHAPQYGFQPAGSPYFEGNEGPGGSGGMGLKWWIIGTSAGSVALFVLGGILVGLLESTDAAPVAVLPILLGCLSSIASIVLYHCWVYKSWELIPRNARYTDSGTQVTPGTAVGYLFIPIYGLYWRFVSHVGLCDALNRVIAAKGSHKRAPNGLAIANCIVWMIPYLNVLVGPWLAIAYLFMVDGAKAEYLQLSQSAAGLGYPGGQPGFPATNPGQYGPGAGANQGPYGGY